MGASLMFIDTSVIVAILSKESDSTEFANKIEAAECCTADSDHSGQGFRFDTGHPFRSVSGHLIRGALGQAG